MMGLENENTVKETVDEIDLEANSGKLSLQQVKSHNNSRSCYLIVHDKVYDATPVLRVHPAGPECLLRKAGMDSTQDFYYHSKKAQLEWKKLRVVGTLDGKSLKTVNQQRKSLNYYRSSADCRIL
jgi:cytochrome b involved in lipid metabolism